MLITEIYFIYRLKKAAVTTELKMEHKGYCMSSCERVCPPKRMPVCGTDWKTYHSVCHLNQAACMYVLTLMFLKAYEYNVLMNTFMMR